MPPGFMRLLGSWVLLMLLLGLEFGLAFVHMAPSVRPVILSVTLPMLIVVAIAFMHLNQGPILVRGFAVILVFWMTVLIGLGSMDPFTRIMYVTPIQPP